MSSTNKPIILILGSGPRVGDSVASTFANNGYSVAIASRKGTNSKNEAGYLSLKADFTDLTSVPALFEAVKHEFGHSPSVVVYNAATLTPPSDKDNLFSIPADAFMADMNVNTNSAYVAAQQAVIGWETLPKDVKKTFIYTGNRSNVVIPPMAMLLTLGVGKAASAAWVGLADTLFQARGYRFFYADERNENGTLKGMQLSGPAHGAFYAELAEQEGTIPWKATFVEGNGYVKFE